MVYKKYIKKDGKLYGPYIYHSKRIGNKVISEYHGTGQSRKRFIIPAIGIFAIVLIVLFFANFKGKITGGAILSSEEGKVSLSLKSGEFIPISSKVIVEDTKKQIHEYNLSDLISESPANGSYYIEGNSLSGNGEGFGSEGEKKIYPEVHFRLELKTSTPEENASVDDQSGQTNPSEQENGTGTSENATGTEINTQSNESQEEISSETPAETSSDTTSTSDTSSETGETSVPITGNIISRIFSSISNFFLSFKFSGNTIISVSEIEGTASFDSPFTYNLNEGESISLVSGSVSSDSGQLDDDAVEISVQEGKASVSTQYYETEKGFGQNYNEGQGKIISINLPSDFDIKNSKIKIQYNGEDLLSLGEKEAGNLTNDTIPEQIETVSLSDDEKKILMNEFGNISVKTIKSELFNGRYVIKYEIGKYNIEYSYDAYLENETLSAQMETDRIKWLKDIAGRLSANESIHEEASQFISNYSY